MVRTHIKMRNYLLCILLSFQSWKSITFNRLTICRLSFKNKIEQHSYLQLSKFIKKYKFRPEYIWHFSLLLNSYFYYQQIMLKKRYSWLPGKLLKKEVAAKVMKNQPKLLLRKIGILVLLLSTGKAISLW